MMKPIHIERPLIGPAAARIAELAITLGLVPKPDPHFTLIYSKTPVDWSAPVFAPLQDRLVVIPTSLRLDRFGKVIVLVFEDEGLSRRNAELQAAGARSDFPVYNAHVTIAADPDQLVRVLLDVPDLPELLAFGPEERFEIEVVAEPAP